MGRSHLFQPRCFFDCGLGSFSQGNHQLASGADAFLFGLDAGLLNGVVERCSRFANVKTVGNFLDKNISVIHSPESPTVRFFIGNSIEDTEDIEPVDLFIRSGGQLRLSGAPRALLGDNTELCSIPTLHPRIRFDEICKVLDVYGSRYFRHSDNNPSRSV